MAKLKVHSFGLIPYEERTPEQRWALFCLKAREQRNWRRSQLAKYFDVSLSTVAYWENAEVFPKNEVVYKMSALLNIPVDKLISEIYNTENKAVVKKSSVKEIIDLASTLTVRDVAELLSALTDLLLSKSTTEV